MLGEYVCDQSFPLCLVGEVCLGVACAGILLCELLSSRYRGLGMEGDMEAICC